LNDDYAVKKKLQVYSDIPFDEIILNNFNSEYEKFKEKIIQFEESEE